ncbi:hypothetical protein PsorP6_012622 [Peronosclerospora sorghi]|uniref:Uncharacterized protein n=1 Tax=Peronosclerospora sorghi TaxID=230839 RepID=A0ACC0WFD8_9STRA|nr:hypothetical protein PsorP6_012622 [Peronosclerospora sorghi]
MMEVARMGKLYATVAETAKEVHDSRELMNAEGERETELWHARLGHVASSRLESIVKVCDGVLKKLVASVNDMKLCDGEMMEVDEDARYNMEVDEEGYDSVPTVREQIPSNTDLNLLPVATVNTLQQPIREQLPVERRPQIPPPTEQQQLGYKREFSDAIVFRPPVEGRLVVRNPLQSTQVDGSEGIQLVVRQRCDDWTNEPEPKGSRIQLTEQANLLEEVPNSYREALSSDNKNEWKEAKNLIGIMSYAIVSKLSEFGHNGVGHKDGSLMKG